MFELECEDYDSGFSSWRRSFATLEEAKNAASYAVSKWKKEHKNHLRSNVDSKMRIFNIYIPQ